MKYLFFCVALVTFLPLALPTLCLLQQAGYGTIYKKQYWFEFVSNAIFVAIATLLSHFLFFAAEIAIFVACATLSVVLALYHIISGRGHAKFTPRMKRLVALSFLIFLLISIAFLFAPLAFWGLLFPLSVVAVHLASRILQPFEEKNNRRYVAMLRTALNAAPHLLRVGITGSAGKTSVKNILYSMLSAHFMVLVTDKNYNTPLGLWLNVKDKNLQNYDIFIAEMGARKAGDIKELVDIVRPDAGIITTVLPQHLETFKTIEAVQAEKSELARGIVSGVVVLNSSDQAVKKMAEETLGEVLLVGDGGNYTLSEVHADYRGTSFVFQTETEKIAFSTELLGAHTAENIALCVALSLRFGIAKEELQFAVAALKAVPHRLELKKNASGILVLDDGYNSNPQGAENALQILATYPGRRVVFSQGLVELGALEREENRALGKKIAEIADIIILTGKLGDYIYEGAKDGGAQIYRVKNVKAGSLLLKDLLMEGDILYLQNDLPELYR